MNLTYVVRIDDSRFYSTINIQEAQTVTAMCLHNAWIEEGIAEEKQPDMERAMTQAFTMWAECLRQEESEGRSIKVDGVSVELTVLDFRG